MQQLPQTKDECFIAYTKFNALARTCKQSHMNVNGGSCPEPEARHVCVNNFHLSFVKECIEEAKLKKNPRK
jgi:hypothetical protein